MMLGLLFPFLRFESPRASALAAFETNEQMKLDQSIPPDTLRTIQTQPFACSPLVGC
jgi:hypothetical protein